jgi:hypothetical protein
MKYSRSDLALNETRRETPANHPLQALHTPFPTLPQSQQISLAWIGPASGPLQWCFQQLSSLASIRSWNHLDDWLAAPKASRASCDRLVVAMDWRDPELTHAVNQLPHIDPTLPVCCLLPDNWLGHRRSHTPTISIPTFYWWQLQDGLIPWLLAGEKNGLPSTSLWPIATRSDHWIDHSTLQKKLAPPALSLFIAEAHQLVEAYSEFLQSLGGQIQHHQAGFFEIPDELLTTPNHSPSDHASPISSSNSGLTPRHAELQVVWWAHHNIHLLPSTSPYHLKPASSVQTPSISYEQEPWHSIAIQTHKLFNAYPNCQVGWITSAPIWNHFQLLQQLGFTRILVPPFHLNGLLTLRAK